ncbi:MAG: FAD-binding oxidoreductase [Bifidobacteriaceae bacterium]|nr:FAD-binding oxidoreductase [Bifidobacteriaceae bacterium]
MQKSSTAIVIGAGIVGSSTAYQLAKAGWEVTLVDKARGAGYGSTSASSGIVRYEYTLLTSVVTAWEAAHMWSNLRQYLDAPASEVLAEFHPNGKVMVDSPAFSREQLGGFFDQLGIEYEIWEAADLASRVPGIDPGRFYPPKRLDDPAFWDDPPDQLGGIFTPGGGFVDDPRLASENFANAAVRAGARTRYGRAVVAIARAGGSSWAVKLADGSELGADVVVNAGGPWSPEVSALAGVGEEFQITTRPLRQEVHAVEPPAGFHPPGGLGPCVADHDLGYYMRPEVSGGLLVGGTEPECDRLDWVEGEVDAVDMNRTAELFEKQVTRAARRFPRLAIPHRPAGVVGVYDVATDWTPVFDKTAAKGFFVAIGTSGNQFKNGPIIGEFMRAVIEAEAGAGDHDASPALYRGPVTGRKIDLGFFSRLRQPLANSGTVAG